MELAGVIQSVLQSKPNRLWTVHPNATCYEAVNLMADNNIGAVLVMDGKTLVGIFTERDYTRKLILLGRSSKDTPVGEAASEAVTVWPNTTVADGMQLMTEKRVRHLAVVDGNQVIGVVSIGDLVKWLISTQSAVLEQLERYMLGDQLQ